MIHAIGTIELNPGTREAWLAEFKKVQPHVRAEKGCIEYGAMVDLKTSIPVQVPHRPDVVMLIEKWESMEHLTAHMTAPHMTTYRQQVKPFVIRLTLQVLEPVS
jgi:quinol monooxygenase YgiN